MGKKIHTHIQHTCKFTLISCIMTTINVCQRDLIFLMKL